MCFSNLRTIYKLGNGHRRGIPQNLLSLLPWHMEFPSCVSFTQGWVLCTFRHPSTSYVSKHVAKIPGALLLYMMESTPDTLVSCCPRALAYMVLERERGLRLQKGLPGSSEWRGELGHGESTGLGRKGNGGSQCSLRQGLLNAGPLLS